MTLSPIVQQYLYGNMVWLAVAIISGVMLAWQFLRQGGKNQLSPAMAIQKINRESATVLDIRDQAVIDKQGAIAGAKQISLALLKDKVSTLAADKSQPVVVVCQFGDRGGAAAIILQAAGFTQVFVLAGGLRAWVEAGLPLKKT